MADVWRGITFEAFRYLRLPESGAPFYTSEHYHCFFRAEGALLTTKGHLAALDVLQATVVRWVTDQWAGSVLLASEDEELQARALAEMPRTKRAMVPNSSDLHNLAGYLLEVVCEESLRARGLLVTDVRVERAGEAEPGAAALSPALRELYLAEQKNGGAL